MESSLGFLKTIDKVPALLIPLISGRVRDCGRRAGCQVGSIIQASGVSSWPCATRLGRPGRRRVFSAKRKSPTFRIPFDKYTQVGLFPIAYTIGTDFKKACGSPSRKS